MGPPPIVTGVSPKEGPPGTRVTVRGEFLGLRSSDLCGLTICGCDCLLSAEWKSPNKIIARSGPGKGRGGIIVTTKSGGQGTSTVEFHGYHEAIGPMKESAVWVTEAPVRRVYGWHMLTPTAYQEDDPLGISNEGAEQIFPEDGLNELFPGCSGDLSSKQFSAGRFLLERHHATPFDHLRAGLSFLRRKVDGQKEGQLSFIKSNVGAVMEQLDTLSTLKDRFEEDVKLYGNDPTQKLDVAIRESMSEANKLFEEVLSRRERADATRSALAVLQRFRFLFSLPGSIERNVKRGDYDAVINDYSRVRNLFGNTEVPVFRKVLVEIESRILQLRELLQRRIQEVPTNLDSQKKLIRNLVNLEASGDPGWDAINSHSHHLTTLLSRSRDQHIADEQAAAEDSSKTPKNKNKSGGRNLNADWQAGIPARVVLVEELTEIVANLFPDLWKLGQAYFSGELQIRPGPGRPQDFKRLILAAITLFCGLLRAALVPHTLVRTPAPERSSYGVWPSKGLENLTPWLPHCLRSLRTSYSILIRLDLPSEALDIVASLIFDIRLNYMNALLKAAAETIRGLHDKETWEVQFKGDHGGITQLPAECEHIVTEALQLVKESALLPEMREENLLEGPSVRRDLSSAVQNLLLAFVGTLETLAFSGEGTGSDTSAVSQLIGSPSVFRVHETSVVNRGKQKDKDQSGPSWEQRLLCVLSNISYTKSVLLPRLCEVLSRHQLPPQTGPVAAATRALTELDRKVLETYLEQRADPLVGTIEPSMYLGGFDWDTAGKPTDVRPYVKELLTNLTSVHAEVQCVSPSLVWRVLPQLVETVAEELSRLMACVSKFSPTGTQQALADVAAVREAVRPYSTPTAEAFFDEALQSIPKLTNSQGKAVVEAVLNNFRSRMRLQLLCFRDSKVMTAKPKPTTSVIDI